jgi:hypothetical protein
MAFTHALMSMVLCHGLIGSPTVSEKFVISP